MGRTTRIVVLAAMALSAPVLAGTEAAADAADITPPVVKAIKDPPFPDGLNHWWITPVHVTWSLSPSSRTLRVYSSRNGPSPAIAK